MENAPHEIDTETTERIAPQTNRQLVFGDYCANPNHGAECDCERVSVAAYATCERCGEYPHLPGTYADLRCQGLTEFEAIRKLEKLEDMG